MPNIKSAIKRVDVAERNRARNKQWKSVIRSRRNEVEDAVKSANANDAAEALKSAYKMIDMAVAKGVLHKNTAARRKSRLAGQVLNLGAPAKEVVKKAAKPAKAAAKPGAKSNAKTKKSK